jgi:toxin ParE1/3/4
MPSANLSDDAEDDLSDIWTYIALDNPRAADSFVAKIHKTCQLLSEFPGGGPLRPELARGLRSFPVGNYLILYRPASHGIDVARVLHGKRNIKRALRAPGK